MFYAGPRSSDWGPVRVETLLPYRKNHAVKTRTRHLRGVPFVQKSMEPFTPSCSLEDLGVNNARARTLGGHKPADHPFKRTLDASESAGEQRPLASPHTFFGPAQGMAPTNQAQPDVGC